jgi:hypothetical protein
MLRGCAAALLRRFARSRRPLHSYPGRLRRLATASADSIASLSLLATLNAQVSQIGEILI